VLEILRPETPAGERTPATEWLTILRGISVGSRNNQLARIAGHLLRRYIDVDLASELLHLINEHRCKPPLPTEELDRTFESICAAELRRRSR
jgi:Primase C terminal 1 (PriCT-1)